MVMVIFNITSAEIRTKSADILLKMTTILKELKIAQLCSKNKRTLTRTLKCVIVFSARLLSRCYDTCIRDAGTYFRQRSPAVKSKALKMVIR